MIYQDPKISLSDKQAILAKETEGEKSDEIEKYKLTVEAGLPSKEQKEKLWKWYLDENAKESDKAFEASMIGFWQWQQLDILEPYIDKFFDAALDICKKRTNHYSGIFFMYLTPALASEHILKRYEELQKKIPTDMKARHKNCATEIVDQKRLLKSYELCRKYYSQKK